MMPSLEYLWVVRGFQRSLIFPLPNYLILDRKIFEGLDIKLALL